jgi:hypothetical protein
VPRTEQLRTNKTPGSGGLRAGGIRRSTNVAGDRSPNQRIERQHSEEDAAKCQAEQA